MDSTNNVHHFDIELAEEISIESAILYSNISFWINKNKANNKHFHEERYWTYNSISAFTKLFPYMTKHKITKALAELEENGYLESNNFNSSTYDRTKWYSCNSEKHIRKIGNGSNVNRKPIPYNKPDINTYKNKLKSETSEIEVIAEDVSKQVKDFEESERKKVAQKKETGLALKTKKEPKIWDQDVLNCHKAILKIFPSHLHPKRGTIEEEWIDTIDKLKRIDHVPLKRVYEIVKSVREDDFWKGNFMSITKLRTKNKEKIPYIVVFNEKFPNAPDKAQSKLDQQFRDLQANSNPNDLM